MIVSHTMLDTLLTETRKLTVELGERRYPVMVGQGLIQDSSSLAEHIRGADCLVVSNETVGPLYMAPVLAQLTSKRAVQIQIPDGEQYKTPDTVHKVIDALVGMRANRDTTVIALGGGVVGDIAGFAAASYMRGVPFIQIPTTLLAQVDSSVGGKTGVNHPAGKNLIGAFHQPNLVVIDVDTLATLPARELSAGLAEVIKHGAIVDPAYFAWLETHIAALRNGDRSLLIEAVLGSCEIKSRIVAEDEREMGRRALLNFGHTFGHAIENCLGYGEWLHGEAVAAGMLMAAKLSDLESTQYARLEALVSGAGLPTAPPKVGGARLREAMDLDKKVAAKALRFVQLHAIGDAYVSSEYSADKLDRVLALAD